MHMVASAISAIDVTLVGAAKSRLNATLPRFGNGSVEASESLSLVAGPVRLTNIEYGQMTDIQSTLYLNWDSRLFSGSPESVANSLVGLLLIALRQRRNR